MVFLFALFFSSLFCYVKSVMTLNVQFTYGSAVVCFNGFSFLFSFFFEISFSFSGISYSFRWQIPDTLYLFVAGMIDGASLVSCTSLSFPDSLWFV